MTALAFVGLVGFFTYVIPYALLQIGILDGNGRLYTGLNVAAASLVLASLIEQFNLASLLIQVTWITIGIVGLARRSSHHIAATD